MICLLSLKYLKDNGIVSFGGFIVGNPDDDEESLWNTFKLAWDLGIDTPAFSILIPHLKTEMREELIAEGLVTKVDDLSTYHGFASNIRTKHLTPEEIERVVEEMYDAYYSNLDYLRFSQLRRIYPMYFWKTVAERIPLALLDWAKKGLKGKRAKGQGEE